MSSKPLDRETLLAMADDWLQHSHAMVQGKGQRGREKSAAEVLANCAYALRDALTPSAEPGPVVEHALANLEQAGRLISDVQARLNIGPTEAQARADAFAEAVKVVEQYRDSRPRWDDVSASVSDTILRKLRAAAAHHGVTPSQDQP